MLHITFRRATSFAFLCGLIPGALAQSAVPLSPEQTAALLVCPISLSVAQENLAARGYQVTVDAGGLSTQYKTSEKDSVRRLLGSFAIERARRYQVESVAAGVRIAPGYRETEYATGVLGNTRDVTRELAVPLTAAMLDTLKDMRAEVCATAPLAAPAAVDRGLEQYLRERCQSGDQKACAHLPAR